MRLGRTRTFPLWAKIAAFILALSFVATVVVLAIMAAEALQHPEELGRFFGRILSGFNAAMGGGQQ